jgi:hypothetical protein
VRAMHTGASRIDFATALPTLVANETRGRE